MRTMYDAVTAANIPRNAAMVAGYIDKIKLAPWAASDWDRFPSATKVTIVKKADTRDGHVLDVEPGDALPTQAPGWVAQRRRDGLEHPTVYMNLSTWGTVRQAFRDQNVREPNYWIALYDGDPNWRPGWAESGVVAKQYKGNVAPGYDLSSVADFWPGVDNNPVDWMDMATQEEVKQAMVDALREVLFEIRFADGRNFGDEAAQQTGSLLGLQGQMDEVISGLSDVTDAVKALKPPAA